MTTRYAVLLRGINLGPRNRVAMPELREALSAAGFTRVRTYVQSGNAVVSSDAREGEVAALSEACIARRFGLDIRVVARSRRDLAAVVRRNPLGDVVVDPKRYQVSFLSAAPAPAVVERLTALTGEHERFTVVGREAYAWHPEGVGPSRLWAALAAKNLGVVATARNWTTVTTLLTMLDEPDG